MGNVLCARTKILWGVILCLTALLVFLPTLALAAGSPVYIGEQGYDTLEAAVKDAESGAVIELKQDVILKKCLEIQSGDVLTIIGNGHKITRASDIEMINIQDGAVLNLGVRGSNNVLLIDGEKKQYTNSLIASTNGMLNMYEGVTIRGGYTAGAPAAAGVTLNGAKSELNMHGGTIEDHYTGQGIGAAVSGVDGASINILGGVLSNNRVGGGYYGWGYGSAVYGEECSQVRIEDCTFTNNRCVFLDYSGNPIEPGDELGQNDGGFGGAVMLESCEDVVIKNCVFKKNYSLRGGAICLQGTSARIVDTRLCDNEAEFYGGGLMLRANGKATLENTEISANKAKYGGGVYQEMKSELTMMGKSAVYGNVASKAADDFYMKSSDFSAKLELLPAEDVSETNNIALDGYYEDYAAGDSQYKPLTDGSTKAIRFKDASEPVKVDDISFKRAYVNLKAAETYDITYTDGAEGSVFPEQQYSGRRKDSVMPKFVYDGEPKRDGYTFAGWLPEVAEKVEGDVTYTAQWKALATPTPMPTATPTPMPTATPTPKPTATPMPTMAVTELPQTGDRSSAGMWIVLLVASVLGIAGAAIYSGKTRR